MSITLYDRIADLISMKQEGQYWDFKKEWYNNKCDLLHDIICFANNLVNRDCYIIIGVDEENDCTVCNVENDPNRRNTQNIVDFLKDKRFAGDVRPIVFVESIKVVGNTIDVIIIKNSFDTPYYLTESYQGVFKNNIYTRVMDSNTPKTGSADNNHIEYLWKKRFRLLETPLERFHYYLRNQNDWVDSPIDHIETKFYKYAPEYRIISSEDENRDGYEYYLFSQIDSKPHWYNIELMYHQTVIESFLEISMDGGRWNAIAPERSIICESKISISGHKANYGYYIKDSLRYNLHEFLGGRKIEPYAYRKYMEIILVFLNLEEKRNFESYVIENITEFDRLVSEQKTPHIEQISNCVIDIFKNDYKSALALQIMLNDFRMK